MESESDALSHGAVHLTLNERCVDGPANVLGRCVPENIHFAGSRIERDIDDVRCEDALRGGWRVYRGNYCYRRPRGNSLGRSRSKCFSGARVSNEEEFAARVGRALWLNIPVFGSPFPERVDKFPGCFVGRSVSRVRRSTSVGDFCRAD